ncbi:MAG: FHA domain-containing protein, partial [Anaerolineales bacterium]|nr:FHA domain-containing protein [Anaerolineales bacterium]
MKDLIDQLEYYQNTAAWRQEADLLRAELQNQFPVLTGMIEPIMYLGLLGGVGGPLLAVAYYITFQGQTGPANAPGVPRSAGAGSYTPRPVGAAPAGGAPVGREPVARPLPPSGPKTSAWLVARSGHNFQLNQGETTIGRSAQNHIKVDGDSTVSRNHAKIVEQNNHFRFYDLGSKSGSMVNGRRVREPVLLAPDDEIQLGDNTVFRLVTSQR